MGTHTQNREMKTNESVIKRQILRAKNKQNILSSFTFVFRD